MRLSSPDHYDPDNKAGFGADDTYALETIEENMIFLKKISFFWLLYWKCASYTSLHDVGY